MIGYRQRAEPRITHDGRAETAIVTVRPDLVDRGHTGDVMAAITRGRRARPSGEPSPAPAAARTALDLAAAVAPAAHTPATAGVAAVCDPLPEGAGAAATEAATVTVACRAGLHVLDHLPVVSGSCDRSHAV